jgi:hypothetical protein
MCLNDGSCKCDDGYITYPSDHYPACDYKQKDKLTAFLLELLIGYATGTGQWYLGNISYALAELLVFWLGLFGACCCGCFIVGTMGSDEGIVGGCLSMTITGMVILTVFGLWLASWIMILTDQTNDGNGAPLSDF